MNKKKKKAWIGSLFFLGFFWFGVSFVCAGELSQEIKKIQAISGWGEIKLTWEKNEYLSETQSIVLVRQKDRCPKSLSDGEEIYRGNGFQFEDKNVLPGEKYCYGVGLLELSGSALGFKVSALAESVNLQGRIKLMFESKLNLAMLFEALTLLFFILLGSWKRKRKERAKAKLILRKP